MDDEKTLLSGKEGEPEAEQNLWALLAMDDENPDVFHKIEEMAKGGDVRAMIIAGYCCQNGKGGTLKDEEKARYWYEKSEDAFGYLMIGMKYQLDGEMKLAREYYQKVMAAEHDFNLGHDSVQSARRYLSMMPEEETEKTEAEKQAEEERKLKEWLAYIDEQEGHIENKDEYAASCCMVAVHYLDADHLDTKKAMKYSRMAKDAGIAESKPALNVGLDYLIKVWRERGEIEEEIPDRSWSEDEADAALEETKRNGSHILVIPEGITRAEVEFDYRKTDHIQEIRFPRVMKSIAGFHNFKNLNRIQLPASLDCLSFDAFNNARMGLFDRVVKDRRTIERIEIPPQCWCCEQSLSGIGRIEKLIFTEGRKRLEAECLNGLQSPEIGYLYLPDSMEHIIYSEYSPDDWHLLNLRIDRISMPGSLKTCYERTLKKSCNGAVKVEYR